MQKKIPMRQCLGCRTQKPKKELIRVVRSPEGAISLDFRGKANGRGAYICPDPACLKKAIKAKALERALDTAIPEEIYAQLTAQMEAIITRKLPAHRCCALSAERISAQTRQKLHRILCCIVKDSNAVWAEISPRKPKGARTHYA